MKPLTRLSLRSVGLLLLLCTGANGALADTVRVAVASNFASTLEQLRPDFERATGHRLVLSPGSSGRHYAQIINGAPFDLFLSADDERTLALETAGRVHKSARRPYAIGRLALWTRVQDEAVSLDSLRALAIGDRIAIANPKLAPYGLAAETAMAAAGLTEVVQDSLVMGENVGQTFQFAYSGSARYAFVAFSQVLASPTPGSYGLIPDTNYLPIVQEMVLLTEGLAARSLFDYLSDPARASVLEHAGYRAPVREP